MKIDTAKIDIEALQTLIEELTESLGDADNFKEKMPEELPTDDVTGVTVEGDSPEAIAAGLDKAKEIVSEDVPVDEVMEDGMTEQPDVDHETDEEKQERIRNLLRR